MTFEDQLNALFFYHLQEHESPRDLVQYMKEDDFAKNNIAPDGDISLSSFCEAINDRGLEQLQYVFEELCKKARKVLPAQYSDLGDLVSIDGSLINAVLTMYWADYRKGSKKAKGHFCFDVNRQIPLKVYHVSSRVSDHSGPAAVREHDGILPGFSEPGSKNEFSGRNSLIPRIGFCPGNMLIHGLDHKPESVDPPIVTVTDPVIKP